MNLDLLPLINGLQRLQEGFLDLAILGTHPLPAEVSAALVDVLNGLTSQPRGRTLG